MLRFRILPKEGYILMYNPSQLELIEAERMLEPEQLKLSEKRARAYQRCAPVFNAQLFSCLYQIHHGLIDVGAKLMKSVISAGFKFKGEYHVTLIGSGNASIVRDNFHRVEGNTQAQRVAAVTRMLASIEWRLESRRELYVIRKAYAEPSKAFEIRESIIQPVNLVGSDEFYAKLSEMLGTEIKPQYMHITLFAKSTEPLNMTRGIGIESQDHFNALNKKLIPQPEYNNQVRC